MGNWFAAIQWVWWGGGDYVWNLGDSWSHLLVLLCLIVKGNQSLQQHNKHRTTKDSELSGTKDWITLLGKELQPANVLAMDKSNIKYVLEEESEKDQLWPHDQL